MSASLHRRPVRPSTLRSSLSREGWNLSLLKQGKVKGVRFETLEKICVYLRCQPGDLLRIEPAADEP